MNGRPCERCGNSDKSHDDTDYEQYEFETEEYHALCSEVQMAFGLLGWLCHDCRKEYYRMTKNHPLTKQYGIASLRLEFWKARIGQNTPPDAINEGLTLWSEVDKLELEMNINANKWLISDVDSQRSN